MNRETKKTMIVEPQISTDLYFLGTFVDEIYKLAIKYGLGPVRDKIKSVVGRKIGDFKIRVALDEENLYYSPYQIITYDFSSGKYAYLERETNIRGWKEKHPKELPLELIIQHEITVERRLKTLEKLLKQEA